MCFFSSIDLKCGYNQVSIRDIDRHKTAFITEFGKYEFNRLFFGAKNAPKFFNRMMNNILENLDGVKVFVDDIIIMSKTLQEHKDILYKVLRILRTNNLTVNLKKCRFLQKEINYLGITINKDGIKPDMMRVKDFTLWPDPKTKRQWQKLLGYINWYRPYVPNLSSKLASLYEKLRNGNNDYRASESDKKNLKHIYNSIKNSAMLFHPDFNGVFLFVHGCF